MNWLLDESSRGSGNLVTVVVFLIWGVFWIIRSLSQAKRREEGELDGLDLETEFEDEGESSPPGKDVAGVPGRLSGEASHPTGPKAPLPHPTEARPQGTDLEELKRELQQMLGLPGKKTQPSPAKHLDRPPTAPSASTQRPIPQQRPPAPRSKPQTARHRPSPPPPPPTPRKPAPPPPVRTPVPAALTQQLQAAAQKTPQPRPDLLRSPSPPSKPGPQQKTGRPGFPYFLKDPVKNAMVLMEILKPYSRGPVLKSRYVPYDR